MSAIVRRAISSNVARNDMLVFGGILLANVFNYLYYLLLGRSLSVLDYGTVMSLVSVVLVVISVGTIGQVVIAKLTADLHAVGDEPRLASFASAVARVALLAGAGIFTIGFSLQGVLADYLHLADSQLVVAASASAAVGFALPLQRGLFQGRGDFRKFAVSLCLDGAAKALLVLPLARWLGAIGALLAVFGSTIGAALYGEVTRRRDYASKAGRAFLDLRRIVYTAGATGASTLVIAVLLFYDVVLAKHFLVEYDAGIYGVAALGGRALFTVVAFLPTVILPEVAARSAGGRSGSSVLAVAAALTFAISAAFVVAVWLLPQLAVRFLAGRAFLAASTLMLPYMCAAAALAFANLFAIFSIARHRFGFVPWLLLIALCEVASVTKWHGSSLQVVQVVLTGHACIALFMAAWLALDLSRSDARGLPAGTSAISID